jgi:hypothetical protein
MESSKIDVGDIVALLSKSIESSKVSQLSITKQSKQYCTTMLHPNYMIFHLNTYECTLLLSFITF